MVKKIVQIPTNEDKIYKQILSVMNFLFEATEQERDVLAELIKLNKEYEVLEEEKRAKFILSTDIRKEIREKLDIGDKQFAGLISRLKSKNTFDGEPFINKKGVVHPSLLMFPNEEGYEITISLRINKEIIAPEKKETKTKTKLKKEKIENITEHKVASPANTAEVLDDNLDNITLI